MRKLKISIILIFLLAGLNLPGFAQIRQIVEPFKLWLINNEAKVISTLSSDRNLLQRLTAPFSIMPLEPTPYTGAEKKLWQIHRKFYRMLNELQEVYALAKRYGNGRFSIILKQARPEIWTLAPLQTYPNGLLTSLPNSLRKVFHEALLKAINLDESRDSNLSRRLLIALAGISDDENRLLKTYLKTFSALYPKDPTPKILKAFLKAGTQKGFAKGIKPLFKPLNYSIETDRVRISSDSKIIEELDDPLAELEKLTELGPDENNIDTQDNEDEEPEKTAQDNKNKFTTPPDPYEQDVFNIWD